jgi:beta-glucosidase
MRLRLVAGLAICAAAMVAAPGATAAQEQQIYLDPTQPLDARVENLLSQLTIQEKVSLMATTAPAIPRLKVPVMNGWNQSLHGVVWTEPTTMFPVNIAMGATWDPELIRRASGAIHDEARAIYNLWRTAPGTVEQGRRGQATTTTPDGRRLGHNGLVYRSPVINMSRQPLWGRVIETYGEDPYLTSRMGVAYVRGMQGDDPRYLKVAATVKHYAANNREERRHYLSAEVSERMLHEYYLPQFRAAIVEGKAQSIMSVYNKLNGVPGAANSWLMTEMLRDHWGFDGFGVTDSGAAGRLVTTHAIVRTNEEAVAKSVRAGHDLDDRLFAEAIPKALEQGLLKEADVDGAVRNILRVRFRLGEFDPPSMVPYNSISPAVIGSAEHRALALQTARESIVLLSNSAGLLPLDRTRIRTIAVIGPHADTAMTGIGYTGLAEDFVKPLQGIVNHVVPGTKVLYARGTTILPSDSVEPGYAKAVDAARQADVAVVFVGTSKEYEREGKDREYLNLAPHQQELIRRVQAANPKTVVVMLNAGPLSLRGGEKGVSVPTAVAMFMGGEEGGNAIAEVLFGEYNPAGRLPYTVYESADQVPGWDEYDITKGYTYMYFQGKPEWAFGHGLSYTTFDYSNLFLSSSETAASGDITVSLDVRNTGTRAGDEVVQLYVRDLQPRVKRPSKQLAGFERITLKPGESRRVSFTLPAERLAFYDVKTHDFAVYPGSFEVMVGGASDDIRQTARFNVTSKGNWPS